MSGWWSIAPYLTQMEQGMVLTGVVQREPYLQLVSLALQVEWVVLVDPTFPLLERWPPGHPPQALYCPMGIPICLEGDCWGACVCCVVLFPVWGLPQADTACGWQGLSSSTWRRCGIPPLGGFGWGGVCSSLALFEGCVHDIAMYTVTWASEGAMALTVMASPWNSVVFTIPWVACCSSSREWNKTTDSIVELWSTPNGWVWPFVTQISMMPSSEIEEASIGVSSLLVMDTRHNLSLKTTSVDGTSWSLKAVVEEVMDILNFTLVLSSLQCGSSSFTNRFVTGIMERLSTMNIKPNS